MKLRPTRRVWIIIALSLIWAIGAGIHTRNADIERAESFVKFAYNTCTYGKEVRHETDLSSCDAERAQNLKTWMEGSTANVATAALGPIPLRLACRVHSALCRPRAAYRFSRRRALGHANATKEAICCFLLCVQCCLYLVRNRDTAQSLRRYEGASVPESFRGCD